MTHAAKIAAIDEMLSGLLPGAPLTHGALTLVPLLAPHRPEPDWRTFAEASDAVVVTEVTAPHARTSIRRSALSS